MFTPFKMQSRNFFSLTLPLADFLKFFSFVLCISISLCSSEAGAQNQSFANRDLSKIEVDRLSDAEVRSIINELEQSGLSESELEELALLNDMSIIELNKLRERIEKIQSGESVVNYSNTESENSTVSDQILKSRTSTRKLEYELPEEESQIYGAKLFNTKSLTFEPSLSISPPKDYKLGPEDELIIDVWGASRNYFERIVDRSGTIRLDNIGPIQVTGMTMAQAESKIVSKLSQIYSGLNGANPNTFAQITLGRLKNIKVTLIGEVRSPGTYTLPSLATVFNALYLSGGPSKLGSFRNIEVIRNYKVIAKMDVYDFLLKGSSSDNIQLMDQDIIRIPTFTKRIELLGEVKRPGIYEALANEDLSELIDFAGGFTKKAYKNRISVERYDAIERLVLDVLPEERDSFQLQNGDKVKVGGIINRFKNRVTISGAVFMEGDYELTEGLTLRGLIKKAEGLKPSAFLERGEIVRELADQSLEVIAFDIKKVISGQAEDIQLQKEDEVRISSLNDLQEDFQVNIEGDIQKPGSYRFYKNMSLQSLILQAGGFSESASIDQIEIARRVMGSENDNEIAKLYKFKVSNNLTISAKDGEFILKPFDQVYVRRDPSYEVQKAVYVQGNIEFPGAYVLEKKNERISDLVKRAGGLNTFAYPEGAKLVRNYEGKIENIGINLPAILKKPLSKEDLFLLPGDRLVIPKELQTVRVNGEVFFPVSSRFQKSHSVKSYVNNAGGFTNKAIRRKTVVRYANGSVKNTSSFLGFKLYPKVEPGAEIIVPTKPERREVTTQEVIGWTTGVATLGLIIVNILRANP